MSTSLATNISKNELFQFLNELEIETNKGRRYEIIECTKPNSTRICYLNNFIDFIESLVNIGIIEILPMRNRRTGDLKTLNFDIVCNVNQALETYIERKAYGIIYRFKINL